METIIYHTPVSSPQSPSIHMISSRATDIPAIPLIDRPWNLEAFETANFNRTYRFARIRGWFLPQPNNAGCYRLMVSFRFDNPTIVLALPGNFCSRKQNEHYYYILISRDFGNFPMAQMVPVHYRVLGCLDWSKYWHFEAHSN